MLQEMSLNGAYETPLWYFAFGHHTKSSLLNQYCRQHNIKYLQNIASKQLQKYLNLQCIIEADVDTLLEWEPKKPNISVIFVGEQFSENQLKIKRQYQQIGRCKSYSKLTNYQSFRKIMYPNLIFFYGPEKKHCEGAAKQIAFQSLYKYIQNFPANANNIVSTFRKSQNYTFSWLFTNPKQIQILNSRFNIRIVNFKYNRADFPNQEKYFDQEYQLVNYLSGKEYFISIDAHATPEVMMDKIGQFLCPRLVFINANNEDQKNYAKQYAKQIGTQLFSIFEIQGINKRKNIPLALNLTDKVRRVNSIIFNDLNLKQVVLVDFPWHVNQFRIFEHVNRKFSWFVDLDPENQYLYSTNYTSNIYFLQTQRRIHPNLQFPLISQIQPSKRYWVAVGPQGIGKTTVSKYLQNQYQLSYVQFEPYVAALKEKLLTPEDGQQLPVKKVIAHFKDLFAKNLQKQYVIDGFSYTNSDLKQWTKQIGFPTVINLKADQKQIIKRQRRKAESDVAAQISQQQSQKVKQLVEKQNQWILKLNEVCSDAVIYTVDYNQSIILAQKLFQSIFQPRVFLIQSNPTLLYQNIAIRHNCCLINLAIYNFEQAKNIAKSSGKRDVIITNYMQTQNTLVSQDLYWIEKNIGKIRYLCIWGGQQKTYKQQLIPLQRPVQVKKTKKLAEGQQGEQQPPEQQPPAQQQGEVKKKKLDIYAYEWTKPICHKNLSQWYFKLKKNVQEFQIQPKQAYDSFKLKLQRINSHPGVNIYEVLKPRQ